MSISTLETKMSQLVYDLGKIKKAGGTYLTDVAEVKHGMYRPEKCNLPAIVVWEDFIDLPEDTLTMGAGAGIGTGKDEVTIIIMAYVDVRKDGFADLHKLVRDIRLFLYSDDNTSCDMKVSHSIDLKPGEDLAWAKFTVVMKYDYVISNP